MRTLPAIVLLLGACAGARAAQNDVTVYRCTDTRGQVELRDTPCPAHQQQQERQMLRPKDAPPQAMLQAATAPSRPETAREVRYVLRQPRPLYECTTPDGSSYTSESPEGNTRWQPAWVAAPPWGYAPPIVPLGTSASVTYRDRHTSIRVGGGRHVMPGYGYPDIVPMGGMWVRDSCAPMPQERACAALARQRDDLRRRNMLRQPSEQARLDAEESSINARLRDECGG